METRKVHPLKIRFQSSKQGRLGDGQSERSRENDGLECFTGLRPRYGTIAAGRISLRTMLQPKIKNTQSNGRAYLVLWLFISF
jgi:hypothetical protein